MMERKRRLPLILAASIFLSGIIFVLWWYIFRPYNHSKPFLTISFDLNPKIAMQSFYNPTLGITKIGTLAFNSKRDVCIRVHPYFLFFDCQGELVRRFDYYKDGTLASDFDEIALANDGTLWVEWPFCYPPQDPLVSHIPCVRRYDVSGRLLLQIGSLEEPQYGPPEWREKYAKAFRQARAVLSKHPNYLWGEEYRFIDRIHGLWVDRKGRVYVLSALPSLHIFDSHGSPLAVFDIHTDDTVTFQGDLGNLEGGTPSFVDWKGRIYTVRTKVEMLRSMIGKIFYLMRHWVKGWEWEKEVTRHWVEVWEWEKEVKKVFSVEVPEVGCVVGVDGQDAIYFSSFGNKRVYQINRFGRVSKIFEPHRWYQNLLRKEWEILFSQDPKLKEKIERKWQAWEAERKQRILENPSLKRELRSYRDIYEYAMMSYGGGPRVGHIAHVDREGNLYLTLVTARHFRIDKVESSSRWERWQRKLFGH